MRRTRGWALVVTSLMVLAVGAIGVAAKESSKASNASTSEAALSDAQRNQAYQASWTAFLSHYKTWLATQNISKLPLHSLRRGEQAASYPAPSATTLAQAVALADEVVVGTVVGFEPKPSFDTLVTFHVTRGFKGNGAVTFIIRQAGGLRPTQDWTGAYLVDSLNEPLMLPGERYLLLLRHSATGPEYEVESFTGMYKIESGRLLALAGNPFGATVTGTAEASLPALLGR